MDLQLAVLSVVVVATVFGVRLTTAVGGGGECFASSVDFIEDCASPNLCIPQPESGPECHPAGLYHPTFSADDYACRLYLKDVGACTTEMAPKFVMADDIILTEEQHKILHSAGSGEFLGAIHTMVDPWPMGSEGRYRVPYGFADIGEWTVGHLEAFYWAIRWMEVNSIVRFIPRTNEAAYVRIRDGSGCSSYLGMTGGAQALTLAYGCRNRHIIIHEFYHALGIGHEHQRPDRDSHVVVYYDRVQESRRHNFYINPYYDTETTPYDYASIMHYESWAFRNSPDQNTIEPVDMADLGIMNARATSPSDCDMRTINVLYPGFVNATDTCEVNTFIPVCRTMESCVNCTTECERHCDVRLGSSCELIYSLEELTEWVRTADGLSTPTPGPSSSPPATTTGLPAESTFSLDKSCFHNKAGVYWVSQCDSPEVCLNADDSIDEEHECASIGFPNSKWTTSRFDCRCLNFEGGSCSIPPRDPNPWEKVPAGRMGCFYSNTHWIENCHSSSLCIFDGGYKSEAYCVAIDRPRPVWAESEDACRQAMFDGSHCTQI